MSQIFPIGGSKYGASLRAFIEAASRLHEIRKDSLRPGDWVIAKTANSVYRIRVVDPGVYEVSGGWFDKHGLSPAITRINGCTWGSRTIKADTVAACGLCIEFPKRLITSPVVAIAHIPACQLN